MTAKPPLQVLDLVNSYGLNYSPCYLCFLPFSTLLLGENLLSHKNVIFKKVIFDSFIDGAFWHFFVESTLGQRFEVSDPPCNSFQGVTAMKNKENLGLNAWLLQNMYLNMSAWKLGWMVQFKGKNVHKPHWKFILSQRHFLSVSQQFQLVLIYGLDP